MKLAEEFQTIGCQACREGKSSGIEFTMAFQPIVDMQNKKIFGYEALARGPITSLHTQCYHRLMKPIGMLLTRLAGLKPLILPANLDCKECLVSTSFLERCITQKHAFAQRSKRVMRSVSP